MTEDKDLERAANCIVYDDEEGFYTQATVERIAQALKEERRRLLNDPRVKGLFETGNAIEDVLIVPDYLGAHAQHVIQQAIEAFRENLKKFESLLKENEEGKP